MDKRSKAAIRALVVDCKDYCKNVIGSERLEEMGQFELIEEGRKFCLAKDPTLELALEGLEDELTMVRLLFSAPPE